MAATNTNGARIKATSTGGDSVTVAYDYSGDAANAHMIAAKKLKDKLGWTGRMAGGSTKDGYVFVFMSDDALQINPKTRAKKVTAKTNPAARTRKPFKVVATKYKGAAQNQVSTVYSGSKKGSVIVVTKGGAHYEFTAPELNYEMPKINHEILEYLLLEKEFRAKKKLGRKSPVKSNPTKTRKILTTKKPCKTCKNFRVSASNDNKEWHKIADFYIQKNALEYAKAYGQMFRNKFIKVESL